MVSNIILFTLATSNRFFTHLRLSIPIILTSCGCSTIQSIFSSINWQFCSSMRKPFFPLPVVVTLWTVLSPSGLVTSTSTPIVLMSSPWTAMPLIVSLQPGVCLWYTKIPQKERDILQTKLILSILCSSEISRMTGVDRKTIRKFLAMENFSPEVPLQTERPSNSRILQGVVCPFFGKIREMGRKKEKCC